MRTNIIAVSMHSIVSNPPQTFDIKYILNNENLNTCKEERGRKKK